MVEQKQAEKNMFRLVGAEYKKVSSPQPKENKTQSLQEKPLASLIILSIIVMGCIFAQVLANHDPTGFYLQHINEAPSREFLFGTDYLGRDIYSILWYGGRISLLVGLSGAAIITAIGIIVGCISGTANNKVDYLLMRSVEICGSIPNLLLVLVLSAVFRTGSVLYISLIIGITGWFGLARIVRSEVRQIRNREYVLYARSCNGSFLYVIRHHLIPNLLPAIMFVVISSIGSCIMMESTLSFLGLGLPVNIVSWGSMLSLANKALIMNTWWVIIFPGAFLLITLVCITSIGASFYRKINPRHSNL